MSNTLSPIAQPIAAAPNQGASAPAGSPAAAPQAYGEDEILLSPRKQQAALAHGMEGGGHAAQTIVGAFLLAAGVALRAAPGWLRLAGVAIGGIQALSGGISLLAWSRKPESR